jgi:hypothetical protein
LVVKAQSLNNRNQPVLRTEPKRRKGRVEVKGRQRRGTIIVKEKGENKTKQNYFYIFSIRLSLFLHSVKGISVAHPASYTMGTGGAFFMDKAAGSCN